ncbi:MAG: hypothetical protein JNM17_23110 [Archangium sp.]|nr:hypothetical protein [Archangium sp.]
MKRSGFGVVAGMAVVFSACGLTSECAAVCEAGCCTSEGRCVKGDSPLACGQSGSRCEVCFAGQRCGSFGLCEAMGVGGVTGGGATGGGGGGVTGGGATGGGATGGGGGVTGGGATGGGATGGGGTGGGATGGGATGGGPAMLSSRITPLAFDVRRGRAVLFGGQTPSGLEQDTWENDGSHWLAVATSTRPSARYAHCLAYDSARERVVLFGGIDVTASALTDTWEFDGSSWTQRTTATAPTASAPCAYDFVRQRVVLFADAGATVWEFDGTNWARRTVTPPAQGVINRYETITWDVARSSMLVVNTQSTWTFNGTAWALASATSPATGGALAYDSSRQVVVSFGGFGANTQAHAQTWEWNGAWSQRTTTTRPAPRYGAGAAFDTVRGRLVLFGGGGGGTALGDTWTWDGVAWSEQAMPPHIP